VIHNWFQSGSDWNQCSTTINRGASVAAVRLIITKRCPSSDTSKELSGVARSIGS
jgi:hypothetical protein